MSEDVTSELSNMTRELWRNMDDDTSDNVNETLAKMNKRDGVDIIEAIRKQQKGNKGKTKPAAESK